MNYEPGMISKAVALICTDIQSQIKDFHMPGERELWWRLSACILSSQVPYDLATSAANAIDAEELLLNDLHDFEYLSDRLIKVLSEPLVVNGNKRNYRFPKSRANYLACTKAAVSNENASLHMLLQGFSDDKSARDWLVEHAPGVGPKQASMFLRDVGMSYKLAILDRHVLNYMSMIGLYSGSSRGITSLKQYRECELALSNHAQVLHCDVGLLDWAIWIVMRVANQMKVAA